MESQKCRKIKRDGSQCGNWALFGLPNCKVHGSGTKTARAKSDRLRAESKILNAMSRLVTPISADDWEANPANALVMDVRRTVSRIRYYDEKLMQLAEQDLIWGRTSEETEEKVGTGVEGESFERSQRTDEAKPHVYHEMQMRERQHLLQLSKVWISANLDAKRFELEQQTVLALNDAITAIVRGLGRDPQDPEVRNVVRATLIALPGVPAGLTKA